jgi:thymidylate synthase
LLRNRGLSRIMEHQYHQLLEDILQYGQKTEDRTGTGTISLFGYQCRYDLSEGFPAVTTKKLAWKAVAGELLWMLSGSSNERTLAELTYGKHRDMIADKSTIWSDNANNQARNLGYPINYTITPLGPIYGYNWRKIKKTLGKVTLIQKRLVDEKYNSIRISPVEEINDEHKPDPYIGNIYKNVEGRSFVVFDKFYKKRNIMYRIQFLDVGTKFDVRDSTLKQNKINKKLLYGVGHYDLDSLGGDANMERMYKIWSHMISRCYNPRDVNYKNYGGRGIYVCNRWHRFSDFVTDIVDLPGFYEWLFNKNYQLDKDYYCANGYAPNTCVFLDSTKNAGFKQNLHSYDSKTTVYFEDGSTFDYVCFSELASTFPEYNFDSSKISRCIENEGYTHKKCSFMVEKTEGYTYRREEYVDQLNWLVNEIKTNPYSRRLILTSFDVGTVEMATLPPCHTFAQFIVSDGKLSCMMTQRSADAFLGVPFNIASYSLLTHLLARECNLEVGEFVHSIGDAHIYLNHVDQVKEQLTREPFPLPKLEVDDDFDLTSVINNPWAKFSLDSVDKLRLVDYISHNTIKAPMAV